MFVNVGAPQEFRKDLLFVRCAHVMAWPVGLVGLHTVQCAMCNVQCAEIIKPFKHFSVRARFPAWEKKVSPTIWNVSTLLPFLLTIIGMHSM